MTKSIVGYSLFDSDEIADLEEKCVSMIKRASKGKLKADSVSLHKRERRVTYQFGKGYRLGRKEQEIAKLKDPLDISPIPEWIQGIDDQSNVSMNSCAVKSFNELFTELIISCYINQAMNY